MSWLTLKTDWTSTDKYNAADINRVEQNTEHLRDLLEQFGYRVPAMTFTTNRNNTSFDTVSTIKRIESNIEMLKHVFVQSLEWQSTVTWTYTKPFTFDDANRWEQSLSHLYDAANLAYEAFRYCGTFSTGQEGSLP